MAWEMTEPSGQADRTAGWRAVLGSVLGLAVGSGAIKVFAFSVLLKPTSDGTGLSRATIGLAFLVGNVVAMLATPLYGRLLDRFGARRVAVSGVLMWAATTAAFALLAPATRFLVYPLYVASGVFSIAQTPILYSKAIASWFDRNRGLALGIGVSGVGLGGFVMPQYVQWAVDSFGWRGAYIAIGAAIAAVAVPSLAFLVRIRPDANRPQGTPVGNLSRQDTQGLAEALRSRRFWTLAVTVLVFTTAVQGITGHLVAMLTDAGVAVGTAATSLSSVGVAVVAGRLAGGYLLDRLHPPLVAACTFALPALGCALLAAGGGGAGTLLAASCLGLGVGAEVDTIGYLTGRYFRMGAYGTIYACLFALVTLGTSAGPFVVGLLAQAHGYGTALVFACGALLACSALVLTLGVAPDRPVPYARTARS